MINNKNIFETPGITQYICILYKDFKNYSEEKLKPYKLTKGLYYYLILICKKPGITSKEVSDVLNVDKAYTARTIKKLTEYGYVQKIINNNDRKSFNIYPTQKCKEIIDIIIDLFSQWEEKLLKDFSKDEVEILSKLLKKSLAYRN